MAPELTINTDQAHSFSVFEAFNIKLQQITPFLGRRTHTQILGKCIWSRSYFFWLFCAGACCREGRGPANVISKVVFGVYLQLCGVRLPVSVLRVVTIVWIIVSPVLSSICKYHDIKLCNRTRHQAPGHDNNLMFLRLESLNSQVRMWNQGGYCQINLLIYPRSLVTT